MQMLTDNAIKSMDMDLFGFGPYAGILADAIIDTENLPFCIGIFGAWGTGKSSLMNLINVKLENQNNIKSIWFNPWKYDKKEDLWNALIQTILHTIVEQDSSVELKESALDLAKSSAWFLLKKGISSMTNNIVGADTLEKIKDSFAKQDEIHYKHINRFEEDFKKVVDDYTGNGKLVIIIDDLDRCLPENAITVLESLKLFIGNSSCVFVLGMDHVVVSEGITVRYGEKIKISGRDYLDKIIQVPFFLPPVPFYKLKEALTVAKTADYSENIWRIVEKGLQSNPRKTKRFVNCFYLLREILRDPNTYESYNMGKGWDNQINEETKQFYLAKILLFQMVFPDFYLHLKFDPVSWAHYEEDVAGSDKDKRESAFEINPKLKGFWENELFRDFMEYSRKSKLDDEFGFPEPPGRSTVISLLNAINIVGPESGNYEQMKSES